MTDTPYTTPAEIRTGFEQLTNTSKYPDAKLEQLVAEFERRVEDAFGIAFTTRTATELIELRRPVYRVSVDHTPIQAITSITFEGSDMVVPDDDAIDLEAGIITLERPLGPGLGTIVYTHGTTEHADTIARACRLFVWHEATAERSPDAGNAFVRANPELGTYERTSTADQKAGRVTGWIDVDRILVGLPSDARLGGFA